jgi:hypothetical protein
MVVYSYIIPVTGEEEIWKITVQCQSRQKVSGTISPSNLDVVEHICNSSKAKGISRGIAV